MSRLYVARVTRDQNKQYVSHAAAGRMPVFTDTNQNVAEVRQVDTLDVVSFTFIRRELVQVQFGIGCIDSFGEWQQDRRYKPVFAEIYKKQHPAQWETLQLDTRTIFNFDTLKQWCHNSEWAKRFGDVWGMPDLESTWDGTFPNPPVPPKAPIP